MTSSSTTFGDDRTRQLLAYLCAALMASGSPAYEAEEDVRDVARQLGHPGAQIHARPGGVTVGLGFGSAATFESVEGPLRLDQSVLLARIRDGVISGQMSQDEALARLRVLRSRPRKLPVTGMYVGGILVAIGLTLILQPVWFGLVLAVVSGPMVVALMRMTGRGWIPAALLPCLAAFAVSIVSFLAYDQGWITSPMRTLLPPVAVLLPGAMIVTGISELVNGSSVSGSARLASGTMQLVMFSLGVIGAAALAGADDSAMANTRVDQIGWWAPGVGLLFVTAGIALMEAIPRHIAPWVLLVLVLTMTVQLSAQGIFGEVWQGAFFGALTASTAAWTLAAVKRNLPRMVLFLPSFWLLVPGSVGLVSVAQLGREPSMSMETAGLATSVILAIAVGLVVGTSIAKVVRSVVMRRRHEPFLG